MSELYDTQEQCPPLLHPCSTTPHSALSAQALVHVKDTGTPKGRGVFASRRIEPGELIEVCPVVQLTIPYSDLPIELQRMVYDWNVLANIENVQALALGFGSLYNHDNPANARYMSGADGMTLIISADRRIDQDEEITINYNDTVGGPISEDDTWFKVNGVVLYNTQSV